MRFIKKYGQELSNDANITKCVAENNNLAIVATALKRWAELDLLSRAIEAST